MTEADVGPSNAADGHVQGRDAAMPEAAEPLLCAFRARREAVATGHEALQRRVATQRVILADAVVAMRAVRDTAASLRSEARIRLDDARARQRAVDAGPPTARALRADARVVDEIIRVLVVVNLAAMRRYLVRQLTRAGHAVVGEAGTGADALTQARALAPTVVLLDLHLPDGLGTDVAARLGADGGAGGARARPAVVFCTRDAAAARAAGARRGGAGGAGWAVLEKPASADALDRAVRDAAVVARRIESPTPYI